jgi:hypothetical protein
LELKPTAPEDGQERVKVIETFFPQQARDQWDWQTKAEKEARAYFGSDPTWDGTQYCSAKFELPRGSGEWYVDGPARLYVTMTTEEANAFVEQKARDAKEARDAKVREEEDGDEV